MKAVGETVLLDVPQAQINSGNMMFKNNDSPSSQLIKANLEHRLSPNCLSPSSRLPLLGQSRPAIIHQLS